MYGHQRTSSVKDRLEGFEKLAFSPQGNDRIGTPQLTRSQRANPRLAGVSVFRDSNASLKFERPKSGTSSLRSMQVTKDAANGKAIMEQLQNQILEMGYPKQDAISIKAIPPPSQLRKTTSDHSLVTKSMLDEAVADIKLHLTQQIDLALSEQQQSLQVELAKLRGRSNRS